MFYMYAAYGLFTYLEQKIKVIIIMMGQIKMVEY